MSHDTRGTYLVTPIRKADLCRSMRTKHVVIVRVTRRLLICRSTKNIKVLRITFCNLACEDLYRFYSPEQWSLVCSLFKGDYETALHAATCRLFAATLNRWNELCSCPRGCVCRCATIYTSTTAFPTAAWRTTTIAAPPEPTPSISPWRRLLVDPRL